MPLKFGCLAIYICLYIVHKNTYTHANIHVHMYMYMYMYIHTHTYIYVVFRPRTYL